MGCDTSVKGQVLATGKAIQANDLAAGGNGGNVTVEAGGTGCPAGDVALEAASIEARGAIHSNSKGGTIAVRSFNCDITGAPPGKLDASGSKGANPGSITLTTCANSIAYSGATTPLAVLFPGVCGGEPTLPVDVPYCNCGGAPAISVDKACNHGFALISPPTPITFFGTVINSGDVTLINVTVLDDRGATTWTSSGLPGSTGITLAPAGSPGDSADYSGSYFPVDCGDYLTNTATASGTDAINGGAPISATATEAPPYPGADAGCYFHCE